MADFGTGIYSLAEAGRLIHVESRTINRWLWGYDHSHKVNQTVKKSHSEPLWRPQHSKANLDEKVIGFQDLLELRIVREFVNHGISLLIVRQCMEKARAIFHIDYPFTTKRFTTDGKTIYAQVIEQAKEQDLLDLRTNQYAFKDIIKSSLYAGIEYEGSFARRWYPEAKKKTVVIDPLLQFGKPMIEEVSVPTDALYASYLAEKGNVLAVARSFDVTVKHVQAAVRFEKQLAA